MRILAIRGCNLASLAGEFEIDLAHGPLGAAGVFAIVGPTGAGKSTLLDAMCVALFDRTPRLANRSTVVVGRGADDPTALGAQDVRSLLRRGASSGWAEVDFESGDGRRYRARWSVRRARNASDGRFQSQQVTLTAIDGGEALGGTKTETLEAIHERLGLSFDQFRRSALLAQGEFATFLRADGKDRSELLERMTGTEIYSKLSIAAHVKAALAEQRLRERQGAALAIAVLSDEERARAEGELELAKQAQQVSRERFAAASAVARWLAEDARRRQALAEAEAARSAAEDAVARATSERDELDLRKRAEALRGVWGDVQRLDRQLAIAHGEASTAADAATDAASVQREIAEERARIAALHAPIREARIAAGLVERSGERPAARERTQARGAQRAGSPGQRSRGRAPAASDARAGSLEQRAGSAAKDARWLLARRELGSLVASWPELDGALQQRAALVSEIAASADQLAVRASERAELAARRAAAATEHQQALARLAEAQSETASFQQKRGLSLDAARRAEDEARTRVAEVERLIAVAADARAAAAARAELGRQLAALAEAAAADAGARRAAEEARDRAVMLRDERARMVDELRKAAGYEHARAELVEGDPCPLCGATEHPWRDRGSFDALIADAGARHAEAVREVETTVATLATLAARDAHRAAEQSRLADARTAAEASGDAARARWRELFASLGELLLVDDPASEAARALAEERVEAARGKLEAARAARSHAEAVAKAASEAQERMQARQADVEHHVNILRDLDRALAASDAALERLRGERGGKLERHAERVAAIDAAFARWLAALAGDDVARSMLELAREALRGRSGAGPDDVAPSGDGDASSGAAQAHVAPSDRAEAALDAAAALDAHVAALLERCRRALGELVAAWNERAERIADLDAELAAALVEIDATARDAERVLAEQTARRDSTAAREAAVRDELAAARARLDEARVAAGFELDELRRLLADSPSRVEELAERLDALARDVERARTLVGERRRNLEDHQAASPFGRAGERSQEDLVADAARVAELEAAVAAADHHAAAIAATLAADADARARRAAALAELAAAEHEAEVDRMLGQIIGSHDGKLFRSFAQSLTLDGLLAVANAHLEELAPRYQLERVPKHDLELQVIDRDLGNEIRSVQSLSGGESFLVSLALALGLSSMSAHDVRVRTLLIDEGFGTLDPATLDSALAVLDALQATGRQVGVISHVPALVERVGAHVRVFPRGGGRSEVVVAEA